MLLTQSEELWAKLSKKYTTIGLKFAKVNVDYLPDMAAQFNISVTGIVVPLPVLILFKNGEKTHVYPGFDKNGNITVAKSYKEKDILKAFDLDSIYNNCIRHQNK